MGRLPPFGRAFARGPSEKSCEICWRSNSDLLGNSLERLPTEKEFFCALHSTLGNVVAHALAYNLLEKLFELAGAHACKGEHVFLAKGLVKVLVDIVDDAGDGVSVVTVEREGVLHLQDGTHDHVCGSRKYELCCRT